MTRSLFGSPIRAGAIPHGLHSLAIRFRKNAKQHFSTTACRSVEQPSGSIAASVIVGTMLTTCAPQAEWNVAYVESSKSTCPRTELTSLNRAEREPKPMSASPDHVVVIAIDGVRWQEVFRGVDPRLAGTPNALNSEKDPSETVPTLHRIACSRGVLLGDESSKVVVSSPSTVSLPGYSELFSGRTPTCAHNECPPTHEPTLLDAWQQHHEAATLVVVSSWAKIPNVAAKDRSNLLITSGRNSTQNLERFRSDPLFLAALQAGQVARPAPGVDDYRPDAFTAEVGIRVLQLVQPSFLFLGLGDTDEYAHQGNYAAYLQALRFADAVVGRVDRWLAERQDQGKRTLLVVTTDHGRGATFRHHTNSKEAARIWMLWSGSSIRARGYATRAETRLADVSPTIRQLMGLGMDRDPRAGRALFEPLAIEPNPSIPSAAPPRDEVATLEASLGSPRN